MAACRNSPKQLQKIRVSMLPRFIMAPVYLADELGFFREAGLKLDIKPLAATTEMIPLLAAGQLDVAFASAIPAVFNAIAKGSETRIVAAREIAVTGCVHEVYGSRKSFPQGLIDARLLKGKRVAVTAPTSLSAFLLDTVLNSAGLDTGDVELLTMRLPESVPALTAGKIDAVVDKDMEFSSPEIVTGPNVADILPGFQYSYIHFGRSLLDGNTITGAAFLWAYLRGVREFRAGKDPRVFKELAENGGLDPTAARSACRTRFSENGLIDPASVQKMIDWSVRKSFVPARMDAAHVIATRFIEQAQQRLRNS
jgi:ABC-type nitrate/sulfonate/bicarbonate transport system substrate-binding protein